MAVEMQIRYELDTAICIRSCARLRGVEGQNVEMPDYGGSKSNLSPVFGNDLTKPLVRHRMQLSLCNYRERLDLSSDQIPTPTPAGANYFQK